MESKFKLSFFGRNQVRKLGQRLFAMKRQKRRYAVQKMLERHSQGKRDGEVWRRRLIVMLNDSIDLCKANNISDCRVLEYFIEGNVEALKRVFAGVLIPEDAGLGAFPGVRVRLPKKGMNVASESGQKVASQQLQYLFMPIADIALGQA